MKILSHAVLAVLILFTTTFLHAQDIIESRGTLHTASFEEWQDASQENKISTAADFLVTTLWLDRITSLDLLPKIRAKSIILVNAIDAIVGDDEYQDLNLRINDVAAFLIVTSDDLGPDE